MVSHILEVVRECVQRVQELPFVPRFSYERGLLRDDGGPNRLFFTYIFCDEALTIKFLKDVKLIQSKVLCETCSQDMTWCPEPRYSEGFR